MKRILLILVAGILVNHCNQEIELPAIGSNIASPIASVSFKKIENYGTTFVLNANYFKNKYEKGNIVRINTRSAEQKIESHVETPRMGRAIALSKSEEYLFAIFEDKSKNKVLIYDIKDPSKFTKVKEFEFEAESHRPLNVVAGEEFFAVACLDGSVYVGSLEGAVNDWTFKNIGTYRDSGSTTRKTMYLHENDASKKLFLFASKLGYAGEYTSYDESVYTDKKTYDDDGDPTKIPRPGGSTD